MEPKPGDMHFLQMSMALDRRWRGTENLDLIPPVSIPIPVDPAGIYTGLPHFCSFGKEVRPGTESWITILSELPALQHRDLRHIISQPSALVLC